MNSKFLHLLLIVFVLVSCTANTHDLKNCLNSTNAGFIEGFWHGMISPISFIVSLFEKGITVYEVENNGNWYNLGFVLGCYVTFKGSSEGVKRVNRK
ncbi:hypothetical protein [Chryseobacterium populi]|uniref:Lipoprotein n=1 Tax=Chryseobacterium populi TaxID=1144316 RepID=J2T772_9FLAO|nr:hypothetical protein [Chryseobacterium populi]EJL73912.1 hypothetical protein PMI13_01340 [Chryseobacterium populi]